MPKHWFSIVSSTLHFIAVIILIAAVVPFSTTQPLYKAAQVHGIGDIKFSVYGYCVTNISIPGLITECTSSDSYSTFDKKGINFLGFDDNAFIIYTGAISFLHRLLCIIFVFFITGPILQIIYHSDRTPGPIRFGFRMFFAPNPMKLSRFAYGFALFSAVLLSGICIADAFILDILRINTDGVFHVTMDNAYWLLLTAMILAWVSFVSLYAGHYILKKGLVQEQAAPSERGPSERGSSETAQTGRAPSERAPSERAPSERAPSGRAPTEQTQTQRTQSGRAPSRRAPSERAPSERAPSERAPSGRAPAGAGIYPSNPSETLPLPSHNTINYTDSDPNTAALVTNVNSGLNYIMRPSTDVPSDPTHILEPESGLPPPARPASSNSGLSYMSHHSSYGMSISEPEPPLSEDPE